MTRLATLAAILLAAGPALARQEVAIRFAAQVNGAAFVCGQGVTGLGSTQATATPTDFRFCVHDIRLTARERADLVAFLDSLADRAVTTDPRWSDPWTARPAHPEGATR